MIKTLFYYPRFTLIILIKPDAISLWRVRSNAWLADASTSVSALACSFAFITLLNRRKGLAFLKLPNPNATSFHSSALKTATSQAVNHHKNN